MLSIEIMGLGIKLSLEINPGFYIKCLGDTANYLTFQKHLANSFSIEMIILFLLLK